MFTNPPDRPETGGTGRDVTQQWDNTQLSGEAQRWDETQRRVVARIVEIEKLIAWRVETLQAATWGSPCWADRGL